VSWCFISLSNPEVSSRLIGKNSPTVGEGGRSVYRALKKILYVAMIFLEKLV
jgi:hypothetical protein